MRDALATHRPFRCKKRSRTRQIFPTRKRIENPFAETRFARVSTRPLHVRKKKSAKTRERRTQDSVKRLVVDIARFRRPSFSLSFLARVPAKKKCAPKLLDGARDANIGAGDSTFFASREWVFAPFSEIHDRLPRVVVGKNK